MTTEYWRMDLDAGTFPLLQVQIFSHDETESVLESKLQAQR